MSASFLITFLVAVAAQEPVTDARADQEAETSVGVDVEPAPLQLPANAVYLAPPKVVGMPEATAATVSGLLAKAAADEGVAIFTSEDAAVLLAREADLQMLGADADGVSLSALGQKVGARWVLAAVVSKVDEDQLVDVRLIDVPGVVVAARRQLRVAEFPGGFLETVRAAGRLALAPLFADLQGTLTLRVTEEGADVLLNGDQIATSPVDEPLRLPGGTNLVTVRKPGFIIVQKTLRVTAGDALVEEVVLRPSAEFLENHRFVHGGLRVGAWSSTTVALLSAVAAGGFGYLWADQNAQTQAIANELNDEAGGVQIDEEKVADLERRRQESVNQAGLFGALASGGATLFAVGGALAASFFIFGQDPGKYDHLVE